MGSSWTWGWRWGWDHTLPSPKKKSLSLLRKKDIRLNLRSFRDMMISDLSKSGQVMDWCEMEPEDYLSLLNDVLGMDTHLYAGPSSHEFASLMVLGVEVRPVLYP